MFVNVRYCSASEVHIRHDNRCRYCYTVAVTIGRIQRVSGCGTGYPIIPIAAIAYFCYAINMLHMYRLSFPFAGESVIAVVNNEVITAAEFEGKERRH